MIFTDIKTHIKKNLDDLGITFYSVDDIDDTVEDAYNDIAIRTRCIIKRVNNLVWTANLSYIRFRTDYSISDYLGTIGIFNQNTNRFLYDNLNLKQFDMIRDDWERQVGEPDNWCPVDAEKIAINPKKTVSQGLFDLLYWATPPPIVDADTPLVASDKQDLFESYGTADLLEQAEEFTKAATFWEEYYSTIADYKERVDRFAKSDLILLDSDAYIR